MSLPIIDPIAVCIGMRPGEDCHGMVVAGSGPLHYAISNLGEAAPTLLSDAWQTRRMRWLADLHRWAAGGVDFIQLREKSLETRELCQLATKAMQLLRSFHPVPERPWRPRLLLNGRADVAAAAGVDGVHLTGAPGELAPVQVRAVYRSAGQPQCLVSVSCHSLPEVMAARSGGADLILFAPVFGKSVEGRVVVEGQGLDLLRQAVALAAPVPVLALGGVTAENASACLQAGAAGVAAIRLFS